MQRLTYVISMPQPREETVPVNERDFTCTSLIPKPVTAVIGLGTRLDVRTRTRLENGVLCNGQQPDSAKNSFLDHSKFEAMKLLSGWELAHSDEDQIRVKIKVSA